ncbi:hypothetical protein MKW98_021062 [Papaver atlanticum]|uniref:Leucine-rich repeat-containing N-terminal plant-type domain-containing protein n=1 Tax=Papaver atlanticum TaxID=357466 RepID=A0AAD4T9N2_9MAGN|nr:hypothetical protein MKW98_021062 [Papaver atlanticum]
MEFTSHLAKFSLILVLICFSFSSFQTTKACHETDKADLLDFKKNIIDEGSTKLLKTWIKDTDCCTQWDGVACDHSNGRVVNVTRNGGSLYLHGIITYMIGIISPSLGNLKFLRVLELRWLDGLNGSTPSEIGKLLQLTSLFLNENKLSPHHFNIFINSKIPSSLFVHMAAFSEINLYFNHLSGVIPSSVGKLVSLKKLDLSWNNLSGSIPSTIGSLKNLIILNLSKNQFSGSIPQSIRELSKLLCMYLSQNRLRGSIPSSISKLIRLYLHNNRFTGSIPSTFSNLKSLTELDLSRNALDGELSTWIGNMRSLRVLQLSNNSFHSVIPSAVINMENLVQFDVSHNRLTGKIPPHRAPFPASSFMGNPGLCDSPLPPCNSTAY